MGEILAGRAGQGYVDLVMCVPMNRAEIVQVLNVFSYSDKNIAFQHSQNEASQDFTILLWLISHFSDETKIYIYMFYTPKKD